MAGGMGGASCTNICTAPMWVFGFAVEDIDFKGGWIGGAQSRASCSRRFPDRRGGCVITRR
ncbi:hypothetical protein [Streptomyces canus]|uniref:hypothetical protein n=1 Tax=Streptomyces canus TaxID=58343 RepID=UPI003412B8BE